MAESKRFLLRLDPDLFDALRRWADDDLRSINAQIEYLLTEQARRAGRLPSRQAKRAVDASVAPSSTSRGGGSGKRSGEKPRGRAGVKG